MVLVICRHRKLFLATTIFCLGDVACAKTNEQSVAKTMAICAKIRTLNVQIFD